MTLQRPIDCRFSARIGTSWGQSPAQSNHLPTCVVQVGVHIAVHQPAVTQEQISWLEREVVRIAEAIREMVERIAERARDRARPRGRDDDWGWSRWLAGVHETLKLVQGLYERMIASADRAEQAVARVDQAIAKLDGLEQRVGRAYDRLERSITGEERRLSFWYFLLLGAVAGCAGAYVTGVIAAGAHWLLEVMGFPRREGLTGAAAGLWSRSFPEVSKPRGHVPRVVGLLGRPVPERGPEPVRPW